jgi:RNA polymerase sigma factor (sigma-70 family)
VIAPATTILELQDACPPGAGKAGARQLTPANLGADGLDLPVDKLTAAMAAGDAGAVETFYRRFFDRLYAWARRATRRDEAFCLDVVQEAVLRIVRTIRPVPTEPQLVAWLRLVVNTTAYDLLKVERRRARRETQVLVAAAARDHRGDRDGERSAGEPDTAADDEQITWLKVQLDAMDPAIARMIELRFQRRWTLGRIGAMFGLSTGTVDGRLRRALATLRKKARETFDL